MNEPKLQRKAAQQDAAPGVLPPAVRAALQGPGTSLAPPERADMENRFSHDFSQVRIHADGTAARSVQAVGARAYTVGQHVVLGQELSLHQPAGQAVLAHELAHVAQQAAPLPETGAVAPTDAQTYARLEAEAHGAARGDASSLTIGVGPRLQKFEGFEHIKLGDTGAGPSADLIVLECHKRDLFKYNQPVNTWPSDWQEFHKNLNKEQQRALTQGLTYGEVVALSGDLYAGWDELNNAPLREVITLIPLIHNPAVTTKEFQKATGGRYMALAKANERHFSNVTPGLSNMDTWRQLHTQAITAAMAADKNKAWGLNATADHFLTDSFAGGHLRTPRSALLKQGIPGQVESRVLHNLDNDHGVEVTNKRGDQPWIAYGDNHLSDPADAANQMKATEAVQLSRKDVEDALSQGNKYVIPPSFAAERVVPVVVDPTKDRWTGRPTWHGSPPFSDHDVAQLKAVWEGRDLARDAVKDDDDVRHWVFDLAKSDKTVIATQPEGELVRMLDVLFGGKITDDDVNAIEVIYTSIADPPEKARIKAFCTKQLVIDQKMKKKIDAVLAK